MHPNSIVDAWPLYSEPFRVHGGVLLVMSLSAQKSGPEITDSNKEHNRGTPALIVHSSCWNNLTHLHSKYLSNFDCATLWTKGALAEKVEGNDKVRFSFQVAADRRKLIVTRDWTRAHVRPVREVVSVSAMQKAKKDHAVQIRIQILLNRFLQLGASFL